MVDRVLDARATGFDQHRLAIGLVAPQVTALAGHLARRGEDDEALALGQLDAELEAFVVLLEDQHVSRGRRAEHVAPHLVWAHGLVRPDVEERPAVRRPGRTVVNAVEDVLEVSPTREVTKAQLVELVAGDVHRVGEDVLVRASFNEPELEIFVALGELVDIQLNLFRGVHGIPAPAEDLVIEALNRSDVVPPALEEGGRGYVGLLDSGHDLLVEPLLEPGRGAHGGVRVLVLGFQVGDNLRVGSLA